jgi:hypothetical protein
VWQSQNVVLGQEHELDVSMLLKLRHSAKTLKHVCTKWPVENGMALCTRFPPYKGQLWLPTQSHGCTTTLAHHSGNFLKAPCISPTAFLKHPHNTLNRQPYRRRVLCPT